MKRIMLSLILALGIHGFFLGMEFDWSKQAFSVSPKSRVISMTLTYIHPQNHAEKPVVGKPVEKKIPQEIFKEKHLSKNEHSYVPEHPKSIEDTFRPEPLLPSLTYPLTEMAWR